MMDTRAWRHEEDVNLFRPDTAAIEIPQGLHMQSFLVGRLSMQANKSKRADAPAAACVTMLSKDHLHSSKRKTFLQDFFSAFVMVLPNELMDPTHIVLLVQI